MCAIETSKLDIKSMLPGELEEYFLSIGEKKFRALQVFSWLHKGVTSFDEMTDLPASLREKLGCECYISVPSLINKQVSAKDGTVKYLWGIPDGSIESVLMEYKHGTTVCVSTQLGCRMGCAFCASTIGGLVRNLTAGEILDQVLFCEDESGRKISNVVLMGIGEPLDNFDNVMRFVGLVCHPKGKNIGARHLTVSTCGMVENIDRLATSGVKLSLAISLHAPDDDTRNTLVPYNRRFAISELIEASKRYSETTGRRVTFEYAMIDGVNDSKEQAAMLSKLLRGTNSHLNLIMLSHVQERNFRASTKANLADFTDVLLQNNIKFTTRRSLGTDIDAACGQLQRKISEVDVNGFMGRDPQG